MKASLVNLHFFFQSTINVRTQTWASSDTLWISSPGQYPLVMMAMISSYELHMKHCSSLQRPLTKCQRDVLLVLLLSLAPILLWKLRSFPWAWPNGGFIMIYFNMDQSSLSIIVLFGLLIAQNVVCDESASNLSSLNSYLCRNESRRFSKISADTADLILSSDWSLIIM